MAEVDRRVTDLAEKTGKIMQQNTLEHVAIVVMDPETKEKMLNHIHEDSYEEMKARVFKYLVHVKGITYEEPKAWGAQLNHIGDGGSRDNVGGPTDTQEHSDINQDSSYWEPWSYQETLSALMAMKGKGKGPSKGGGACKGCGKQTIS